VQRVIVPRRLTMWLAGPMLTTVTGADHVRRNRVAWDRWAAEYAGPGLRLWEASDLTAQEILQTPSPDSPRFTVPGVGLLRVPGPGRILTAPSCPGVVRDGGRPAAGEGRWDVAGW
jgi:hypothetical protein